MFNALFITIKKKSTGNSGDRSHLHSHELDNWQRAVAQGRGFSSKTDHAQLISIAQGPEGREGSLTSMSSHQDSENQGIHKDVTVSQSYEVVH